MNKFHIFGGIILLLVLVVLILTSIIGTTDGGKNLSDHACERKSDYIVGSSVITGPSGDSCTYSLKEYRTDYTYFESTEDPKTPYLPLKPVYELVIDSSCSFINAFSAAYFLVLDKENNLYACVSI